MQYVSGISLSFIFLITCTMWKLSLVQTMFLQLCVSRTYKYQACSKANSSFISTLILYEWGTSKYIEGSCYTYPEVTAGQQMNK